MEIKKPWLRGQVEQGEPSTEGEWFTLELAALIEDGYAYVEIHYPDDTGNDDENPNSVRFTREDGS